MLCRGSRENQGHQFTAEIFKKKQNQSFYIHISLENKHFHTLSHCKTFSFLSELSPKPTFRKPEASQKLQDLESHPGSWGWRQHIPTCSNNPHLHCFPSATKCEADKFIRLISSFFLGCYRSYKHFWHNTPIFGNATARSLAGKASLMLKALHTCTDWTHQDVTQSVGLLVLKQGFPVNYTRANTPGNTRMSLLKC